MGKDISLKRGYDIKIKGAVLSENVKDFASKTYAIKPTDFLGIAPIPKLVPEIGAEVKAGDPLFYDKKNPDLIYSAPVSGEVIELKRGAKRSVSEVVILADADQKYKDFGTIEAHSATKDQIQNRLIESGAWHFLRQRPFNTSANPADTPKAIFISGYYSGPLSVSAKLALQGREDEFRAGITALSKLAPVQLTVERGNAVESFSGIESATINQISGPHPAGNVGIQIHHIDPIRKGEVVWTIDMQDVANIGRLIGEGVYKRSKIISVSGNGIDEHSGYYRVISGVQITELVEGAEANTRIIDGDVLSGRPIPSDGYLGFYTNQISVIPEGDEYELFGWLFPSYLRPTRSKSLMRSYNSTKPFEVNTNTHGERRAFVMSGEYEKVLPMNLFPVQLLKAILANDFEQMEGLGIYEVVEEDLALCEFVCTSKQPVQSILRNGLDYIREQG